MNRRDTLLGLLALGAASSGSMAQQAVKIRRVGFLSVTPRPASLEATYNIGAFLKAMRELGWIEGRNVAYEWRFADRRYDRVPGMTEELVQSKVDMVFYEVI